MIAARVQVIVAGLVVLARRDDRCAGAFDRWWRIGEDDVEALGGELEVVPAVGDDDLSIRVGQDRMGVGVVVA